MIVLFDLGIADILSNSSFTDTTDKHNMCEEMYKGKFYGLVIAKDIDVKLKHKTKHVEVTNTKISIIGKREGLTTTRTRLSCDWKITIPLVDIKNLHSQSFKAQGLMNFHKDVVGVEAMIDGVLMNYAIFSKDSDGLFKAIAYARAPELHIK